LWKDNFKKRKAKIQRCGKRKFLKKIKRKQSNRTKDINHKVSKKIVDYAAKHRKTIILENLSKIKNSKKCGKFVKKSNWAYAQLETFIRYKSSLRGIPVLSIDPAFSSKECSKCGSINDVNGKRFVCKKCGHEDHRDSNAGFNIASRGKKLFFDGIGESVKKSYGVISDNERELSAGHIDVPLS
jgi:IS605 OrfB family transposase